MADRVARVLPALVEQPGRRAPLVLDEAVAVAVAVRVDPLERGERVRPERADEVEVAGPAVRLVEEDQPQRRRVDRAVVRPVRELPGPGQLADAQLVEDLARLHVPVRIVLGRLPVGQDPERLARDVGHERQDLERGDDAVPPEQRREPRDARPRRSARRASGRRSGAAAGRRCSDGSRGRAARRRSGCARSAPSSWPYSSSATVGSAMTPAPAGDTRSVSWPRCWISPPATDCARRDGVSSAGCARPGSGVRSVETSQRTLARSPGSMSRVQAIRTEPSDPPAASGFAGADLARRERHQRPPEQAVEALVGEDERLGRRLDRPVRAAMLADPAADLEDVGRVGVEVQLELDLLGRRAVVRDLDVLGQPAGDPAPAHHRDRPHRERLARALLGRRVAAVLRVRQLDGADVVRRGLRPEQRRADAVDPQDRARQHARVEVVQAEAARIRVDVAERVGQQEQVAVLEHADAAEVRRRDDHGTWRRELDGRRRRRRRSTIGCATRP